ncbi:splicing factor, Prp19-binding domain-containing protein [Flammula alnicola]|nr:splicing factor, Prp19-binding domain-containing protein [Flammula alnicola]
MSATRKQAPRLARPAVRYWKGKAPKGAAEVESDSEAEEAPSHLEEGDVPLDDHEYDEEEYDELPIKQERETAAPKAINIALKDVSVSKEGKVIVAGREESGRTALEEEEEEEEEESEEEAKPQVGDEVLEEESSEYESDSEEEEKVEFRPVFVPKRARVTIAEKESIAQDTEEALRKKEAEAEERRKQSHDLVAESIRRELAEKEKEEEIPDVDDTDGLDPATEFEAWRLRELGRIKKEKEDELAREKEREEVERRRAMPEEQRMKEDLERAQKLREEKPKGQQKFLQKYWHKGAFHQDEEILKRHDFTEATESTMDVSMLPKVMQVKNFGKRSRTKYTHLLDQDTTVAVGGFGGVAPVKAGGTGVEGGGCFLCGGPHLKKDCPQNNETGRPTGANATHAMNQRHGVNKEGRGSSWRDGDGAPGRSNSNWRGQDERRDDEYRKRSDSRNEDGFSKPPPSRSRQGDDHYKSRRRSRERTPDRDPRDKRRRIFGECFTTANLPNVLLSDSLIIPTRHKLSVAVVGTGLAGLTAAHLLTKQCEGDEVKFEVHLFEKASTIGMDSSSVSLPASSLEQDWRIDVPMRSFQGGYYANLIALYKSLGVKFRQADFSYSFSSLTFPATKWLDRSITTTMIYNGGSGRAGVSMPSGFGTTSKNHGSSSTWVEKLWISGLFLYLTLQLIICYLITLFHSLPFWRSSEVPNLVFRDWASHTTPKGILAKMTGMDVAWKDYVQTVLIPLVSAVCTAPDTDVMSHPMEEILDYVWLTFGTHHYVVLEGVRDVVARLTAPLQHFHLASPIVSIKPDTQDPRCVTIGCLSNGQLEEYPGFHHIIMATQACGAVPILNSYLQSLSSNFAHRRTAIEGLIQSLKAFQYRPAIVINHTDGSLLPDSERDVRDLNLISLGSDTNFQSYLEAKETPALCVSPSYTMATHILRTPKGYPINQPTVYQTTNPIIPPKKDSILSVATLERAIVTMDSKKALKSLCAEDSKTWWQCPYQAKTRLGDLQGAASSVEVDAPGIWICGSYAHLGIPLLEGCVISARNVVEQGILRRERVQWEQEPWIA